MNEFENILRILPKELRNPFKESVKDITGLNEIRLRTGFPVYLRYKSSEMVLYTSKQDAEETPVNLSEAAMKEAIDYISNYSMYAINDEIGRGFVTVAGGHRVGICGRTVLGEDGRIRTIRNISSINIRVAHEVYGSCQKVLNYIFHNDEFVNTLIVSSPGAGKTTLLRDILRHLSEHGVTVGIADERSEIAAVYQGRLQNRLGPRVDILDGCPKSIGINMLIRSMSPDVIAVDEIGEEADNRALRLAAVSGCKVIATAHGSSIDDVKKNVYIKELIEEGCFKRVICLTRVPEPGTIEGIYGDR